MKAETKFIERSVELGASVFNEASGEVAFQVATQNYSMKEYHI
jgi:hypothetical protein